MASVIFMPFLRPLPLPRVASIQLFRRQISTQPCLRKEGLVLSIGPSLVETNS